MARNWYPVVDYITCVECGTCVDFCPHSVYDKAKAPSPVVTSPANCIDHCHKCGNLCPAGAIAYVGDNTGWTPPHAVKSDASEPCYCGCAKRPEKKVVIEYLYLDLTTCNRCVGTDAVLAEVVAALTPALELAGFTVVFERLEISSAEEAMRHRFVSSPTIRVNGRDICQSVAQSSCACCGDISGTDVDCRVFQYEGRDYEIPTKAMLAEFILRAVFSQDCACVCGDYELPDNLKRFFEGKASNTPECSCGRICKC